MKTSLASPAMLAAFGRPPTRVPTGSKALRLTKREWADVVRGNVTVQELVA